MKLIVNGKESEVLSGLSLAELIQQKRLKCQAIIVEYNGQMVMPDHWDKVVLDDGDKLEIVTFVGGG